MGFLFFIFNILHKSFNLKLREQEQCNGGLEGKSFLWHVFLCCHHAVMLHQKHCCDSIFKGQMPFLSPDQQQQSTGDTNYTHPMLIYNATDTDEITSRTGMVDRPLLTNVIQSYVSQPQGNAVNRNHFSLS